jgi:hypothetical protein
MSSKMSVPLSLLLISTCAYAFAPIFGAKKEKEKVKKVAK